MYKFFSIFFFILVFHVHSQQVWVVPESAKQLQNPLVNDDSSFQSGSKIYQKLCASCHGKTGKGDVPAMQNLNPPPANFTTSSFQEQTDGAIFYKISEGRGLMASYKNMLSEKERWLLVNYLRSFNSSTSNTVQKQDLTQSAEKNGQDAFPFTTLINAKTTKMAPGFGLILQHRFGATKFDENFIQNFMGLDLAANMRFAFEIPVNNKLNFEIGRTRYGKFYDVGAKYLWIQQSDKSPVSVVFYENIALTTEKAPQYTETATFDNGEKFSYQFKHRLFYDTQVIMSRRFSNRFSMQFAAEFLWRNLTPYAVKPKETAYVIAFPIALRYKTGLRSAISLEIMPNSHHRTMPISLGYEIASSGNHVFQITLTNTDRILSQQIFFNPTIKYPKDGFMLGFNLIRYF